MADNPGVLELRVHGVHGTPPSSMLGVDSGSVGQVAGDGLTGFYRAKGDGPDGEDHPTNVAVEAYSWGALTSGVSGILGWVSRAGWLFLLPFALVNLAYWARPDLADGTTTARNSARLVRVAGLLLTMMMVLAPSIIGIDLLGWQCFRNGSSQCQVLPGFFDFLAQSPFNSPPRRIVGGMVLPLFLIVVLWFLSRKSMTRYEEVEEIPAGPMSAETTATVGEAEPILRRPMMWNGQRRTKRLQRLHIVFAVCTVISFSGLPIWLPGVRSGGLQAQAATWLALVDWLAMIVAVIALVMVCALHPDDVEYSADSVKWPSLSGEPWSSRLRWTALALLLAHLALLAFPDYGYINQNVDYFGNNVWFIGLFIVLTAVHLMLFVIGRAATKLVGVVALGAVVLLVLSSTYFDDSVGFPQWVPWIFWVGLVIGLVGLTRWHYAHLKPAAAWGGAGSSVLVAGAVWVGLLFTTAAVCYSANFLNGSDQSIADVDSNFHSGDRDTPIPNGSSPQTAPGQDNDFTATGDVTLDGALIELYGSKMYVVSGTIRVGSLDQNATSLAKGGTVDVTRGSTELFSTKLAVPDEPLILKDSCVRKVDRGTKAVIDKQTCTSTSGDFIHTGTLNVPKDSGRLEVGPDGDGVFAAVGNSFQAQLVLPQVLIWSPLIQLAWFLGIVGVVIACVAVASRRIGPALKELLDTDSEAIAPRDRGPSQRVRFFAAITHRAERLLDCIGVVTSILSIVLIVASLTGNSPWQITEGLRSVATLSLWASLGISAGLVLVASRIRTSDGVRKAAGILWDLTTFWPRSAHPLAPPCYAERVVPELRTRIHWALNANPGNHVVMSGHSQGSLLVMAVVSRLSDVRLERVRIVTYGSQIRAWYGRIFPAVFGPQAIGVTATDGPANFGDPRPDVPAVPPSPPAVVVSPTGSLLARLGGVGAMHWVNLFRRSDPIGFRVFTDLDSPVDVYVPEVPPAGAGDPGPHVMGHSGYPHAPQYQAAIAPWFAEVPAIDPPVPVPTFAPPPLPPSLRARFFPEG